MSRSSPAFARLALVLCASLVAVTLPGRASAQLTVDRSIIEFSPGERIQDIEVTNDGDFRLYLDLKVAEIHDPQSAAPRREEFDDPRTAPVIVTPRQVLLPPGERKRVRVVMRDVGTDVERVFRLAVKPYTGKVRLEGGEPGEKASAIKVLVGYDLLLLSRPARLDPKLAVTRTEDSIEFRNEGNTNILVRRLRQCDAAMTDCADLSSNRLYAGETWKVALPRRGSAERYPVEVRSAIGLLNKRTVY